MLPLREKTSHQRRRARSIRLIIAPALLAGLGILAWNAHVTLNVRDAVTRPATRAAADPHPMVTIQPNLTLARLPASMIKVKAASTTTPASAGPATSTRAPASADKLYLSIAMATTMSGPDVATALARRPTSLLYVVGRQSPTGRTSFHDNEDRLSKYVASRTTSAAPAAAVIPGEPERELHTATPMATSAVVAATATPAPATDTPTPAPTTAATAAPAAVAATATPAPALVVDTATPAPARAVAPAAPPSPTPFTSIIYASGANVVIPKLNIAAPVYDGGLGSDGAPVIAQGYALTRFYWGAKPGKTGNMVLYGHDDIQGSIFANLPNMSVGDRIYIDTSGVQGVHRYIYQVSGSQIVLPADTWVMNPTSGPTITLLSCTPFNVDTHRIAVKGALVAVDGHAV